VTAAQLPLRGPRRGARPRMILRYPTHTCSHAPCLRWVFLAPSQAILSVRASQEDPLAATFPPHEEIVNVWLGSSHTGGPHPETTDDEIALCHAEGGFGNMPSSSTGHPLPTLRGASAAVTRPRHAEFHQSGMHLKLSYYVHMRLPLPLSLS